MIKYEWSERVKFVDGATVKTKQQADRLMQFSLDWSSSEIIVYKIFGDPRPAYKKRRPLIDDGKCCQLGATGWNKYYTGELSSLYAEVVLLKSSRKKAKK